MSIPDPFIGFKPRQNAAVARKATRSIGGVRQENVPRTMPKHDEYRCPVERWVYEDDDGLIVAQGIVFDCSVECYLILQRKNGEKRWVWTDRLPVHESRKLLWKADTTSCV